MRRLCVLALFALFSLLALGCGPDATEIVVRDPFAVSFLQLEGATHTPIVPAEAPPTPPADKIERAILASHSLGESWSFPFESPGAHGWTARRYHRGGIEIWSHDYGNGKLLDDDGVIAISSADSRAVRITYDRATCELVIRSYRHTNTRRHGGAAAYLSLELRTPMSNVMQIRSIHIPEFSDQREMKVMYP